MLLVIAGSSHNTYSDPLALFSEHVGWIFRLLGLTARLDPVLGVHLVNVAILGFLSTHLPLSAEQRQLQTWAPSSGHSALHRISELDDLDRRTAGKGPLAWLFPGRGVFNAMSDMVLDRMLGMDKKKKKAVQENGATTAHGGRVGEVNGAEQQPLVRRGGRKDSGEPDDVVSAEEVLESALPSAEPASGQHPHAPGVPLAEVGGEGVVAERFDARQRQILRASVGHSYADAVRLEHRDEALALLGEHHVFKCEVHV